MIGPYEINSIVTGDARELAKAIPDASVDLIFTDPPYPKKFNAAFGVLAETGRTLKEYGRLLTLCGHYQLPLAMQESGETLIYDWIIAQASRGRTAALFQKRIWASWKPCLVYRKGTITNRMNFALDIYGESDAAFRQAKSYHDWGQGEGFFAYYINRWTQPGDVILDPFCGGGTVPAVCKKLDRNYLAFEIDPNTAELARRRIASIPIPLPFERMEQMPL